MPEQHPEDQRALNDIEAARMRSYFNILISNEVAIADNPDDAQAVRTDATNALSEALADPDIKHGTADVLIKRHARLDTRESVATMYAYVSLVRRTRQNHPEAAIPRNFLTFIEGLAQDHGETDVAFQMMALLSDIKETDKSETKQADSLTAVRLLVEAKREQLDTLTTTASSRFASFKSEKHIGLVTHASPKHISDQKRLEDRANKPNTLLQDILNNRFLTPEGYAAAKAQHDADRLAQTIGYPNNLYNDILNNRYTTSEGLAAAKAQHDADRLARSTGRPTDLHNDIVNNRFMTAEGYAAAKAQHDADRLQKHRGAPSDLYNDIQNGRFMTSEGLAAARIQQDNDRLKRNRRFPNQLRQDLQNGRFLTRETIAEVRQILGM